MDMNGRFARSACFARLMPHAFHADLELLTVGHRDQRHRIAIVERRSIPRSV